MEATKLIMISVLMGSLHQKVANYVSIDTFITIVLDSNLEITLNMIFLLLELKTH